MAIYRTTTSSGLSLSLNLDNSYSPRPVDYINNTSYMLWTLTASTSNYSQTDRFTTGDDFYLDVKIGSSTTRLYRSRNEMIRFGNANSEIRLGTGTFPAVHDTFGERTLVVNGVFKAAVFPATREVSLSIKANHVIRDINRGPRIKRGGKYQRTATYVKVGGTWRPAIPYVKDDIYWTGSGYER